MCVHLSLYEAKWSMDNHEQTMQVNFLSDFLVISTLLDGMCEAPNLRLIMVGAVTGNNNTVGDRGVYTISELKQLERLKEGFSNPVTMADEYNFIGVKAYNDSKFALILSSTFLHSKFHKR
jgi:NAD(P)-dependent dehydrogenase (short-subunit alcohol dehydrogenase family)